ncbi:MAG: hypothetical protein CR972_01550 [Candidatus Moraniibacteriota bacterium]|nr:MAG: hypothetical protein CR972_01550 [Candidatus Moranbacteria bacterium]
MSVIKKIFIVSTILLLVLLIFFGIYTVAFKKSVMQPVQKDEKSTFDIADFASKELTNVTSDSVISATIGPNGDTIRYYDANDGRVWTMTLRGTNKEVLNSEVSGVPSEAKWSLDGNSVILKYENGEIYTYNHATGQKNKLRDGMDDVEWAGTSGKILYKYFDKETKERSLNIANSDGTNWKKIADLPYRFTDFVQIPSSILAAFWPRAEAGVNSSLFTASTISENEPKKVFEGMFGADFLFSPDGKKALISSVNTDGKVTLGVIDTKGKNYTDFLVPTIARKAVWSEDGATIYFAMPTNVPDNVVWPDDYNAKKFMTKDTFFKMDVNTGKKVRIIELEEIKDAVDAVNLFLSPSEDMLFFTDRNSGLLYRLSL